MSGQPALGPFSAASHPCGACPRFLIVDDEPVLLRAMQRVLHAAGPEWAVVCARHGLEALDHLSHESFDAVVLDLQMPVMDGLALLHHLVAHYPGVRRIVHSSHVDPANRAVLAALAHEVLAKPAPPQLIVDALERSLARADDPAPTEPAQRRPTC